MLPELRILIERAVRPVAAPRSVKRGWREELAAHLEAIHAEEFARGGSPEEILFRTQARFGDPEALSQELSRSVTRPMRISYRVERWVARDPGEAPPRFALRIAILMLAELGVMFVLVALCLPLIRTQPLHYATTTLAAIGAIVTMLTVNSFWLAWLSACCTDHVRRSTRRAWRDPVVWLFALAAGAIVTAGGLLVLCAVGRQMSLTTVAMQPWLALGATTLCAFPAILQAVQWELDRDAEWDALELTPGSA